MTRWLPLLGALAAVVLAGDALAQSRAIVTSGLSSQHEARPGEVVTGTIALDNVGTEPWTGTIRLADYRTDLERPLFEAPGAVERSCAGWMSVEPSTFTLAPSERGTLNYRVSIPDDPTLRGSYWGVVLIQDLDTQVVAEERKEGFQLLQASQTAVRINVEVGSGAEARLEFSSINLEPSDQGNRLDIVVANSGERWGKVTPRIELYDPNGTKVGPFFGEARSLYPGSTWKYALPLTDVPPGDYAMLVIADGGPLGAFATRRALHVP